MELRNVGGVARARALTKAEPHCTRGEGGASRFLKSLIKQSMQKIAETIGQIKLRGFRMCQ